MDAPGASDTVTPWRLPGGPQPGRFHDGGDDDEPPSPGDPPRVVLERLEVGDLHRRTERFRMLRRIAYRDREYGELLVPADLGTFDSDLVSVPALFTWLVPRTGRHLPPALLHDGLVRSDDEPASFISVDGRSIDRVAADRIFRAAMRDTDTGPVRAWLIWSAVTLATIWRGSSTWSRARHWRYLLAAGVSLLLVVVLGVVATLDLLDIPGNATLLPWMGDRPWWLELVGGAAGAVAVPLVLGLAWGRFAIAGVVTGVALALLLHVTVVLAVLTGVYLAAERVAARRRLALAAMAAVLAAAVILTAVLSFGWQG